jgi:hypothetical protein
MCIYCLDADIPFHLRKSTAFSRTMSAEEVEVGPAEAQPRPVAPFSCDSPEPAVPPSVWPKRKPAPSSS